MADRGDRLALARFVNDLEQIPNASGGGGLSPRLEAELINMLSRPYAQQSVVNTGQAAATFTLLGLVIGVLGLATVLWLNTLFRHVQEQTDTLKSLGAAFEKSENAHRQKLDVTRLEAKENALDTLLREVRAGSPPERFVSLYTDALRKRDETQLELQKQSVNYNAVFDTNLKLQADLADAKKKAAELKEKADKAADLSDRLAETKALLNDRESQIADRSIFRRYDYAWYAAIGGWTVTLILALTLSTLYAKSLPAEEPKEETPHAIT
jgi:hypothetical protein